MEKSISLFIFLMSRLPSLTFSLFGFACKQGLLNLEEFVAFDGKEKLVSTQILSIEKRNIIFKILVRRRTRVWALAHKPESVDASFRFSHDGGVSSHEVTTKSTFCFLALIRCLVKFVVLESLCNHFECSTNIISQSTLTYSAILQLFAFPSIFFGPNEICLIVAFTVFHSSDLQQYN